jgi:RNA polymerase sigma factor (sigma-70 family)
MFELPNNQFSDKAMQDLYLIKRALEDNDQEAYTAIVEHYKESVFFMLLKMVGNRDDAEDLTMETFSKAFSKLAQYTPTHAFSTWLFKIATNNCIDFIRKKKEVMFSIDKTDYDETNNSRSITLNCPNADPEKALIKKQKQEQTRKAILKLKPIYKTLIELRYFQELSYEEIAEVTQFPLGTVKAQIFRAKEMLLKIMKLDAGF